MRAPEMNDLSAWLNHNTLFTINLLALVGKIESQEDRPFFTYDLNEMGLNQQECQLICDFLYILVTIKDNPTQTPDHESFKNIEKAMILIETLKSPDPGKSKIIQEIVRQFSEM